MNISVDVILYKKSFIVEISKGIKGDAGITAKYRNGVLSPSDFSGSPRKATVVFTTPWDVSYVPLTPTGADGRLWTIEDIDLDGFTINSNSDEALTGLVYYATLPLGEST